ncbi:MAG TPA: NAD(P)-dependent alcohol dehydrogenase [Telluria sp.]|jgi:NADPH:quinone reductase-like Zn-dependent oxidoreductase
MEHFEFRTAGGHIARHPQKLQPLPAGYVRLRVSAIGLNFRDLYVVRGNAYRARVDGCIPFTDAVGTVEAVGECVTRFQVGARACTTVLPAWTDGPLTAAAFAQAAPGVFASTIDVHESTLVAAPVWLSDAQAATLPVAALTAWHAIGELGVIGPGDAVVVQSTGGVAVFAIQFAAALGASVIVVSRSDGKLARARQLGATHTINSSRTPDWEHEVLAITGGAGAKLVLDMGLDDSLRRSVRAAAFEATVAVIGVVQQQTNRLDIYPVMNKNLRIRGVETGSRSMFVRMNLFMATHRIAPVISAQFAASEVEQALDHLAQSPFGKVVVTL